MPNNTRGWVDPVALTFGEVLASWCAIASHGSCDNGAQEYKARHPEFIDGVLNASPHVLISKRCISGSISAVPGKLSIPAGPGFEAHTEQVWTMACV